MDSEKAGQHLVSRLSLIAEERVDPMDNAGQAAKWNRYMRTLDKIDNEIHEKKIGGVFLRKNVETNIHDARNESSSGGGIVVAWVFLLIGALLATFITLSFLAQRNAATGELYGNWMYFVIPTVGLWAGFIYVQTRIINSSDGGEEDENKLPEVVKMSCKPEIHINELEHVHDILSGLPRMERDPVIALPALEIAISRDWIIQESVHGVMDKLSHIELPENLKQEE